MEGGIKALPKNAQDAFETFTSQDSTPKERADARKELEQKLPGDDRTAEFLNTVETARDEGFNFSGVKVNEQTAADVKQWNAKLHDLRNRTWADGTAKFLNENPNSRMLIFAGTQHFRYEKLGGAIQESANEQVSKKDFGTTVLQFTGGDFGKRHIFDDGLKNLSEFYTLENGKNENGSDKEAPDGFRSAALRYTRVAQEAKVADKNFAFRIKPNGPREADYVIHLKQN
jgi:hypothetical protein